MNEISMSPVQFVKLGLAPEFDDPKIALSQASYHFRILEKADCIVILRTVQKRGSTEHIYRGKAREYLAEEFEDLTPKERSARSRALYQGLAARMEWSMAEGTCDRRPARRLSWLGLKLDEKGWAMTIAALSSCEKKLKRICSDAGARLDHSEDKPIWVTVGLLGIESPPPPESSSVTP
ncbi:MAG: hypothetical protein ACTHN7_10140 [Solirubrobacterales bacterium]